MKLFKYILVFFAFSFSNCNIDNLGPLLDENTDNLVFFSDALVYEDPKAITFDGEQVTIGEQETYNLVIEVGAILKNPKNVQVSLGGTAVLNTDYTIVNDLNLDFSAGASVDTIVISLIDNENFDDDHTIILSLPEGLGYSENNKRELTVNIVNNELSEGTLVSVLDSETDVSEEGINGTEPGKIDLTSSDIEFGEIEGNDSGVQMIGTRFTKIQIPQGATIISARVQFTVNEDVDTPAPVVYDIFGEAVGNSTTFTATPFDISSRPLTTASVNWNIPLWQTTGEKQTTADVKDVIQEIIDRTDWEYNNSLNLIYIPTTETLGNPKESGRVATSNKEGEAPVLTIEWQL